MEMAPGEKQMKTLSEKIAVEKYAVGKFSLSEAASFAGVSAGEMMELLAQKGIKANYTLKEAEESYNRIGKFLEK
jgi:predicted HTH domain antitoxin